jgi:hypothetical protein
MTKMTTPTWLDAFFKTILNGTAAPAATLGNDGDFYIDTVATRLYGPKTDGAWGAGVALKGEAPSRETISDVGSVDDYDTQDAELLTIAPIGPGAISLTGLLAPSPADARQIVLYAEGRQVTIEHNDAASDAENRIYCPGAVDLLVAQGSAVQLTYDPTLAKWFLSGVTSSTTPGGSVGSLQYHDAGGVFAGMGSVANNAGNLSVAESAPTTGATGQVTLACVQRAGKRHLVVGDGHVSSWVRATGGSVVVGPHPGHVKQSFYNPWGNAETSVTATFTMSLTGTLGAPSVASTSLLASTCRIQSTSTTAIGSFASLYESSARLWRGNAAGRGGFYLVMRFAPEDAAAVSGARMFVGLHTSVAGATNVEPNTLTSIIGVCQLSASNNLHLINNDGSGTATTVDLGSSLPANGNTALYELTLWCPPNEAFVGYRVERIDTGDVVEGTLTTDLPPSATFLARRAWRTNNGQTLAVRMSLIGIYAETLV